MKIIKERSGQSSAEFILLIGGVIVIVLLIGTYISDINKSISNELKKLLETQKEYLLNKV
ncbi:MAG: class III signal peptide-containing protein [Methanobacteriaceae archaeon]|jgi:uncharacterized protein (UPF0333 family)|nr:class III signal peptide-containing protein [Methanobacteriaceae archaeon]